MYVTTIVNKRRLFFDFQSRKRTSTTSTDNNLLTMEKKNLGLILILYLNLMTLFADFQPYPTRTCHRYRVGNRYWVQNMKNILARNLNKLIHYTEQARKIFFNATSSHNPMDKRDENLRIYVNASFALFGRWYSTIFHHFSFSLNRSYVRAFENRFFHAENEQDE